MKVSDIISMLWSGSQETLLMVFASTLAGYVLGLPLGVLLTITDTDGISPHPVLYKILDLIINITRSIPFLILLILIQPFTKAIVGKSYGTTATVVPLTVAAAPFIARMVEGSLKEVDHGVIEAALSMGARKITIITKVLIAEARTSLLVGVTIALGTILGYSAMAGVVVGGGLGDIAIRYGYYRYETGIMLVTVLVLVVLMQILQWLGTLVSKNWTGEEDKEMNLEIMKAYLPLYRKAMVLTLKIGWLGIALAILIGLICALVRHYKIPVLQRVIGIYIELFRNTPLLVQLFFLYFGLPRIGLSIDAAFCGVLGLALLGGAYMAESFRSGLEAVEAVQMESALSLGMSRQQAVLHVILPQAVSISVPAFVANIIFLLKETSVFSAISLMDLMFTAKDLIGLYYKTVECLTLLVIFYLIILLPVSVIGSLVERRMRYAGFGD